MTTTATLDELRSASYRADAEAAFQLKSLSEHRAEASQTVWQSIASYVIFPFVISGLVVAPVAFVAPSRLGEIVPTAVGFAVILASALTAMTLFGRAASKKKLPTIETRAAEALTAVEAARAALAAAKE